MLICSSCRSDNPETARFCASCGERFGLSPEPGSLGPDDPGAIGTMRSSNETPFSFAALSANEGRGRIWGYVAVVGVLAAVSTFGWFYTKAKWGRDAYDASASVKDIASVLNEAHRNGCTVELAIGASSDQDPATFEKNAFTKAKQVKALGAKATAVEIGRAETEIPVSSRLTGARNNARWVGTVVALHCDE